MDRIESLKRFSTCQQNTLSAQLFQLIACQYLIINNGFMK